MTSTDGSGEPRRRHYNSFAGGDVGRIQSLADAVFAVAMTLLVLDVRLPESEASTNADLIAEIGALLPHLAAYLLSFLMLGTFWLALHTLLQLCRRADRPLNWAVLIFLLFVTLLPFSASVLADNTGLSAAIGLYWLHLAALGGTLGWVLVRARRFVDVEQSEALQLVRRRLVFAQILYAIAGVLCLVSPTVSLIAFGVFQLLFIVSPRLPWRI